MKKLFLQKYNFYIAFAFLIISACSTLSNTPNLKVNSLAAETDNKITTLSFKTPVVAQQSFADSSGQQSYNNLTNLKNPVLLATNQEEYNNYKYSSSLCNVINSSFSNIQCILYLTQGANKTDLIKKTYYYGNEDSENKALADLTIMRVDEYNEYLNTKTVAQAPLDIVSYLNGEYLYMFTNSKHKVFTIEQFNESRKTTIKVIAINTQAAEYINKYIEPLLKNKKIVVNVLEPSHPSFNRFIKQYLCTYNSNYDIFAYFGDEIPANVSKLMRSCSSEITPITISDKNLVAITQANPNMSVADVTDYFPLSSVSAFLTEYLEFAKINPIIAEQNLETGPLNLKEGVVEKQTTPENLLPIVKEEDLKNTTREKTFYNIINLEDKVSIDNAKPKKLYYDPNAAVKSFGIRYVLLASRYTRRETIYNILDGIYKDFNLMQQNYITQDIKRYSVKDMLMGTSSNNKGFYHVGVYFYPRYSLLKQQKKTPDQNTLITLIASNISLDMVPSAFGPENPSYDQIAQISKQTKDLAQKRKEFAAIQILQREFDAIEKSIEAIKEQASKQQAESAILESLTPEEKIDATLPMATPQAEKPFTPPSNDNTANDDSTVNAEDVNADDVNAEDVNAEDVKAEAVKAEDVKAGEEATDSTKADSTKTDITKADSDNTTSTQN